MSWIGMYLPLRSLGVLCRRMSRSRTATMTEGVVHLIAEDLAAPEVWAAEIVAELDVLLRLHAEFHERYGE